MNHLFLLNNKYGAKVFIPIASVLKDDSNPALATNVSGHPYNTMPKDKHSAYNPDPKYKQTEHRENWKTDFDVNEVDVDEQKRLYEEAQRTSRGGKWQNQIKASADVHVNSSNDSQQNDQLPQRSFSVSDNFTRQQQFHSSQFAQHQNPQPPQRSFSVSNNYTGQQQFHSSQFARHQSPQPHYGPPQDFSSSWHSQSTDPVAQMAHIPRAGVEENNAATGHSSRRKPSHHCEQIDATFNCGNNTLIH